MTDMIHWFGHASFKITASKIIYIDPWKLPPGQPKADIILVSHSHFDHLSLDDIKAITQKTTTIVAPSDCAKSLIGYKVTTLMPGETTLIDGINIEAVSAYNLTKNFHPRSNNWVGYILMIDGIRIYYSGDTDATPEMTKLQNIDVAMLPVGGNYPMDAETAANIANQFKPARVIPYHWGDIVGSEQDAVTFSQLFKGETIIQHPYK